MVNKTVELNKLFEKLELRDNEHKNHLVKDGIINEKLFVEQRIKVLFICKEPNNPKKKKGDYRDWWKTTIKYSFSHRLGTWSYGLIEDFPPLKNVNSNIKLEYLSKIAFINLKKIGGTSTAKNSEILHYTKMNRDILQEQIKIINPDIIVLCLSWWRNVIDILFKGFKHRVIADYVHLYEDTIVINFYHPSTTVKSNEFLYNELKTLIRKTNINNKLN